VAREITGFQYSIYKSIEAPKEFLLQTATTNATTATGWRDVGVWTNASNDGCAKTGGTKEVNISTSKHDVLAFALGTTSTKTAKRTFALACYRGVLALAFCAFDASMI
jgi:hypothetical protein